MWTVAGIIVLIVVVALSLQTTPVQNFVKEKAVSFIENKIKTRVRVGKIFIGFPKDIALDDVFIEDQKKDTLWSSKKVRINLNLIQAAKGAIHFNSIRVEGVTAHISRSLPDSAFNFDYIIKAFAGPKKTPAKKDTSSTDLAIYGIDLTAIHVKYDDEISGNFVSLNLGSLHTTLSRFDLKEMRYDLDQLSVQKVNAQFKSTPLALKSNLSLGGFLIKNGRIDLTKETAKFSEIHLGGTLAAVELLKTLQKASAASKKVDTVAQAVKTKQDPNVPERGWQVEAGKVSLENNQIVYDNDNVAPLKAGFDYNHVRVRDLVLEINRLTYRPDFLKVRLETFSFAEKCGFLLRSFSSSVYMDTKKIEVKDFALKTNESELNAEVTLHYPSIQALSTSPGIVEVDAQLDKTQLGLKDALYFQPSLGHTAPFNGLINNHIYVGMKAHGLVNNLNIQDVNVHGLSGTALSGSAKIEGLPDVKKLVMDVKIKELRSVKSDLLALAPSHAIPSNIHLPEWISLQAHFKGTLARFDISALLRSALGNAQATAQLAMGSKGTDTTYHASVSLSDFNVGRLIGQTKQIGKFSLTAMVKGKGLGLKTAVADISGALETGQFSGYTYRGLHFSGRAKNAVIGLKADMADPNASFTLATVLNLQHRAPAITLNLLLDSIRLKSLHLDTADTQFRGALVADIPSADLNNPNGKILLTNFQWVKDTLNVHLDTASAAASSMDGVKHVSIRSPFLQASLDGKITFSSVGDQLMDLFDHYYAFRKLPAKMHQKTPVEDFTFSARLNNLPLLRKFVPSLKALDPVSIDGKFNSTAQIFQLNATAPKIVYGGNHLNGVAISMVTDANALNYSLQLDSLSSGSLGVKQTELAGMAKNNNVSFRLNVKDERSVEKYTLAGSASAKGGIYKVSFDPNGLRLNYDNWKIAVDNFLQYGKKGLYVNDLNLENGSQSLHIQSARPQPGAPLQVTFKQFDLATVSKFIEKDSVLVRGSLDGSVTLDHLTTSPVFISDLNIRALSYKKDTIGDIGVKVNNKTPNLYAAKVSITGKGNNVVLSGDYNTASKSSPLNLSLSIQPLNLASVESLSFGQLSQASGTVTGQLAITGSPSMPQVLGTIHFNKAGFDLTYINSYLRANNERIDFTAQGIHFNQFTLRDSAKNQLVIDGDVLTKTYTDFAFDMNILSENFKVLNTSRKDNKLFYGKVYLNSDIDITGNLNKPVVDANIKFNRKTDFTFVLPSSDPSVVDRQGVVEFLSQREGDSLQLHPKVAVNKTVPYKGLDVSADIETDSAAKFTVVIDEQSGDALKIKGAAQLNTTVDPSGKVSLTGTYEINDGSYQLTLNNLLKRNFTMKRGSVITWTGEPTAANVDITAVYTVNTDAVDLMNDDQGIYKQKHPFQVDLVMKGELLKPIISFFVGMTTDDANLNPAIKAQLDQLNQNQDDINKQAFALLVLGRFIGQDPLKSGGSSGFDASNVARQSASKLLSSQLNKVAGSLIKGVDLNFDLNSTSQDYSTGTQQNKTDLKVGVSKNLNDRVSVSVGTDIALEGQNNGGTSNNLIGDVSVEYKVSKDGRYRLRAYRKSATEEYVEGQFIETGVSFIFVLDYERFRELFKGERHAKISAN